MGEEEQRPGTEHLLLLSPHHSFHQRTSVLPTPQTTPQLPHNKTQIKPKYVKFDTDSDESGHGEPGGFVSSDQSAGEQPACHAPSAVTVLPRLPCT